MLKRFYADNYKCLVNFEYKPAPFQLLIGRNGSGKTTVFEALQFLREAVISGNRVDHFFRSNSVTRWQNRSIQTFELDLQDKLGLFRYRLTIEQDHDTTSELGKIKEESLTMDDVPVFLFQSGEASLFHPDGTQGPKFPVNPWRSGLGGIPARHDTVRVTRFKERLAQVVCVRPNPWSMALGTDFDGTYLQHDALNFSSWYRNQSLDNPRGAVTEYFTALQDVFDDFESLRFKNRSDKVAMLQLLLKTDSKQYGQSPQRIEFDLEELSEGQRILLLLYALLYCAVDENHVLLLDEPDNFVALAEIQPWLMQLMDKIEDRRGQVLIISHNSEVMNYLATIDTLHFFRHDNGPTRIKPFLAPEGNTLSAAELVARGWEDE
jgi:energy-coupling factor transporter ATP-binding protein EcfA2